MLELLDQIELLRAAPPELRARLAQEGRRSQFPAGSYLLRQGEPSESMHIILSGRVRVERDHPRLPETVVLTELAQGEAIGEMGIIEGKPRSASVIAAEATETLELNAEQVAALWEYPDVVLSFWRQTMERLRANDELVEQILAEG